MKRLISLLGMAMLVIAMHAGNSISLSTASGHPGEEVTIGLSLANTDAVSALEITIPLGEHLKYVDGSCRLNAGRVEDHQVSASQVDNALKIYIYSFDLKAVKGNEGQLLEFKLKLGKEPGSYSLIPSVMLSNAAGTRLACETGVNGSISIFAPKISISSTKIDFGHIPLHATYSKTFTLANTGNEPLSVESIALDDNAMSISEQSFTVASGSAKDIVINYTPVTRGEAKSIVVVTSNAINGTQKIEITADPYSVNELHVGNASGIGDDVVTVTLSMNNMEPIVAIQTKFILPEALVYVDGSAKMLSRSNGHQVVGTASGQELTLAAYSIGNTPFIGNEGEIISFDVRLKGTSGTYYLNPIETVLSNASEENMMSAVYPGNVSIQSPKIEADGILDFGNGPITEPLRASYSVHNSGSASMTIDRIIFLAEQYNVLTKLPLNVGPGETGTISVQYTPTVEGQFGTTMQVYSNDPTNRMKSVTVKGSIYAPNSLSLAGETQSDGGYKLSVALSNYTEIVALQFDVVGLVNATYESFTKSARLSKHSVSVVDLGNDKYRILAYSMGNDVIDGNDGEIMSLLFSSKTSTTTEIKLENVTISDCLGTNKCSALPTSIIAKYGNTAVKGDVNGDGVVDIADINTIINIILQLTDPSSTVGNPDINGDTVIDIADLNAIINIILKLDI